MSHLVSEIAFDILDPLRWHEKWLGIIGLQHHNVYWSSAAINKLLCQSNHTNSKRGTFLD